MTEEVSVEDFSIESPQTPMMKSAMSTPLLSHVSASSPFGTPMSALKTMIARTSHQFRPAAGKSLTSSSDSSEAASEEHHVEQAAVNALANMLLIVFLICSYAVFFIFQGFVRSLFAALLAGLLLFPMKQYVALKSHSFLHEIQAGSKVPFFVAVFVVLPFRLNRWLLYTSFVHIFKLISLCVLMFLALMVEPLFEYGYHAAGYLQQIAYVSYTIVDLLMHLLSVLTKPFGAFHLLILFAIYAVFIIVCKAKGFERLLSATTGLVWASVIIWTVPIIRKHIGLLGLIAVTGIPTAQAAVGTISRNRRRAHPERLFFGMTSPTQQMNNQRTRKRSWELNLMLFVGCLIVVLVKYLPYAFIWVALLGVAQWIYEWLIERDFMKSLWSTEMKQWMRDSLVPWPVRKFYSFYTEGDQIFVKWVKKHIDTLTTIALVSIVIVLVGVFLSLFVLAAYGEAVEVAQLSSETWQEIDKADWISPENIEILKTGVARAREWALERMGANFNLTGVSEFNSVAWKEVNFEFVANFVRSDGLTPFLRENMAVMRGLISQLKDNVSLVIAWVLSILWSTASGVLATLFSFVVFLTALFYLISSSDAHAVYRPYEWIHNVFPTADNVVRSVVESVFDMTVTISVFHGLFTWLSYTLLGAKLVYLSTILSSLFGVLPFIGAYWVTIPAALELWFHAKPASAILLVASHVGVTWIIDPLIYGESQKAVHPYLTGLSVVGGLFFFGPEGVLLGPLLLITLMHLMDLMKLVKAGNTITNSAALNHSSEDMQLQNKIE